MELEIGSISEGRVTAITKFGAFVSLSAGKTGLVHISEVAHSYVNDIRDHLKEGQEVRVRVLSVGKDGRVNLSIKKAGSPPDPRPEKNPAEARAPASLSFEDKLKQFMQESHNKMSDISNHERRLPRRGGRRPF